VSGVLDTSRQEYSAGQLSAPDARRYSRLHRLRDTQINKKDDPILAQIRAVRTELAERFGNDIDALCDFLVEREQDHKERLVNYAPRLADVIGGRRPIGLAAGDFVVPDFDDPLPDDILDAFGGK